MQTETGTAEPQSSTSFLTTEPEIIILEQAGLLRVGRGHKNGVDAGILYYVEQDTKFGGFMATKVADDLETEPSYSGPFGEKVPFDDLIAADAFEIAEGQIRLYKEKLVLMQ